MSEPRLDPNAFGAWFGAIVGGGGGTLAGLLGALTGSLVPRGKGKRFLLAAYAVFTAFGLVLIGVGIAALIDGQPFAIWFFPVQSGMIFALLSGMLLALLRPHYRIAERRKMEADDFRGA